MQEGRAERPAFFIVHTHIHVRHGRPRGADPVNLDASWSVRGGTAGRPARHLQCGPMAPRSPDRAWMAAPRAAMTGVEFDPQGQAVSRSGAWKWCRRSHRFQQVAKRAGHQPPSNSMAGYGLSRLPGERGAARYPASVRAVFSLRPRNTPERTSLDPDTAFLAARFSAACTLLMSSFLSRINRPMLRRVRNRLLYCRIHTTHRRAICRWYRDRAGSWRIVDG